MPNILNPFGHHLSLIEAMARSTEGVNPFSEESLQRLEGCWRTVRGGRRVFSVELAKDAGYDGHPFIWAMQTFLNLVAEPTSAQLMSYSDVVALQGVAGKGVRVHSVKSPFAFWHGATPAIVITFRGVPIAYSPSMATDEDGVVLLDDEAEDTPVPGTDFKIIDAEKVGLFVRAVLGFRALELEERVDAELQSRVAPVKLDELFDSLATEFMSPNVFQVAVPRDSIDFGKAFETFRAGYVNADGKVIRLLRFLNWAEPLRPAMHAAQDNEAQKAWFEDDNCISVCIDARNVLFSVDGDLNSAEMATIAAQTHEPSSWSFDKVERHRVGQAPLESICFLQHIQGESFVRRNHLTTQYGHELDAKLEILKGLAGEGVLTPATPGIEQLDVIWKASKYVTKPVQTDEF